MDIVDKITINPRNADIQAGTTEFQQKDFGRGDFYCGKMHSKRSETHLVAIHDGEKWVYTDCNDDLEMRITDALMNIKHISEDEELAVNVKNDYIVDFGVWLKPNTRIEIDPSTLDYSKVKDYGIF